MDKHKFAKELMKFALELAEEDSDPTAILIDAVSLGEHKLADYPGDKILEISAKLAIKLADMVSESKAYANNLDEEVSLDNLLDQCIEVYEKVKNDKNADAVRESIRVIIDEIKKFVK